MAYRPPDFKTSGIRAERIIASGSSSNPRLLLIGSASTGNDGINVDTSNLVLAGTGSDTWLFISGSKGGNDRVTFGGDVFVSGSLTVTGSLVTLSSENLIVGDSLILFGTGSTTTNSNGGIALASGSSVANQALVWGRVATDTWGAVRKDVENGTNANTTTGITLIGIRGSKIDAGGPLTFISSSDGQSLSVAASTQVLILSGGNSSSANPRGFADTNFFVSGSINSIGTAVRGTSTFGGDLFVSGNTAIVGSLTAGNGYGSTGTTIAANGNIQTNGTLTVDGTSVLTGNATFGGNILTDADEPKNIFLGVASNTITIGGSGSILAAAGALTVGGGYGSTGVSISSAGLIQADGNVTAPKYEIGGGSAALSSSDGQNVILYSGGGSNIRIVPGSGGFQAGNSGSPTSISGSTITLVGSSSPPALGTDTYLFVSGALDGPNKAVFGGNVVGSGSITARLGLSGSLTRLSDGTSYLIAGSNVTITSASNGSVTISSTGGGGGGTSYFVDPSAGKLNATGSLSLAGALGSGHITSNIGADTFFFVSGSKGSIGTSTVGTSVFGGDVKVSGSLHVGKYGESGRSLTLSGTFNQIVEETAAAFYVKDGSALGGPDENLFAIDNDAKSIGFYTSPTKHFEVASYSPASMVLFLSGSGASGSPNPKNFADTSFYVSGSIGSKNGTSAGAAVFGGDVVSSGSITSQLGLSGSLTKLADGTSYLVAGANVTITSASNGSVTISSTGGGGGGGSSYFSDPVTGKLNTTGSLSLAGNLGPAHTTADVGSDVFFFSSGSMGTITNKGSNLSLFGGDVASSGSFLALSQNGFALMNLANSDLYIRNRVQGGTFVASVNTSAGNTVNFLDVRPNGMATGSVAAIFPGLYAGTSSPFTSHDTTFFVSGKRSAKGGNTRGTSVFGGDMMISGSTYLGTDTTDSLVVRSLLGSDIIPDGNRTRNLGSESARFANIYTGDLHLRNERGDWTIVEEPDYLSVINNRTGVKYKMMLERIQD